MTNEALEHEIRPIMDEFKVRHPIHPPVIIFFSPAEWFVGSRDVRRMLRQNTSERLRGVLLRSEGCPQPDGSPVRFKKAGPQAFNPTHSTEHVSNLAR